MPGVRLCPRAMAERQQRSDGKTLKELFAAEPDRLTRYTATVAGIYFDWSKTHLDGALVGKFVERAERM